MSFHGMFFKGLDVLYRPFQNGRRSTRFRDVRMRVLRDVVYDEHDKKTCRLDIYLPADAAAPLPVMFYLHGGGFEAGDKRYRAALSRWFASLGYAVVNVNYGLAPRFKFPVQHRQVVSALNFVCDNARAYGFDTARMAVGGDSAGAYFASVLACICNDAELQARLGVQPRARFGAALLNCGVYDMYKLASENMLFSLGRKVFKDIAGLPHERIAEYRWRELCSVPDLVTPEFPRSFVVCSERDTLCGSQHAPMLAALEKCGVPHEVFVARERGDDHCFSLMWKGRSAERANGLIADFLTAFKSGGTA